MTSIIFQKIFRSHTKNHQQVNDGEEKVYREEKQAEVNRGVLRDLLRLTMKSGQVIDFKEALK